MLSAVSQQIQTIQEAIRAGDQMSVNLVGKSLNVNPNMAIFITMNPGYSGRSNLPDNLKQVQSIYAGLWGLLLFKSSASGRTLETLPIQTSLTYLLQLFRSLAMTQPDRNLIAQVMLFSQGFSTAEVLAKKIVPLFT